MSDKRYPPDWQDFDPAREPLRPAHPDLRKLAEDVLLANGYAADLGDLDASEFGATLAAALTAAVCERIAAGLEVAAAREFLAAGDSESPDEVDAWDAHMNKGTALKDAAKRVRVGEWTGEGA